ncbi:hypothetical protein [Acetivibrio saccincola]|uniref:hypothetical protein n=1 Tax=Acetivibrio saccincola TaxID=1677857 RepID=UPI0016B8251A|nr:hypothetical protein [Acetivibrio saccincola]NLW25888.1 hypothetical protein [Acetivibrio saccincola]HOA96186.1 hypothetical protein [Acetivibrio saccincola]HQD28319.1 hypothetical protein [Acetivibrio saccincola]
MLNNFKVNSQEDKIVIEYPSIGGVRIILLVILLAIAYTSFRQIKDDLISINSLFLLIFLCGFLFFLLHKENKKCIFDKSNQTISIQKTNLLKSFYETYSFYEMTKLKIEKTLCDDEDSDDEIEYILSIELNQKSISIAMSGSGAEINKLADDIIMLVEKSDLAVEKQDVLLKDCLKNHCKEELTDGYCEETRSFENYFRKHNKISRMSFNRKIRLIREGDTVVLKMNRGITDKIVFIIIIVFTILLAKHIFVLETIHMERNIDGSIDGEVISNFLGKEEYETERIFLKGIKDVKFVSDSDSSYFVIVCDNYEYITSKFGEESLNSAKSFLADDSLDSFTIKENFEAYNIAWIFLLLVIAFQLVSYKYISKIIIDAENKEVILEMSNKAVKGKYPLHILRNIDYIPKGNKYRLFLYLLNKREGLGTMRKEDVTELREFLMLKL